MVAISSSLLKMFEIAKKPRMENANVDIEDLQKSGTELTDLAVYASTKHKEPNEYDFEEGYFNEDRFLFRANSPGSHIYFTFKSENGCKIKVVLRYASLKYRVPSLGGQNVKSNDVDIEKRVH